MNTVISWKTSAAGILLGSLMAATNQPDWKHLAIAFGTALLGILAKDAGVS